MICRDLRYKYSDGSQQTDSEIWVSGAVFSWPFGLSIFLLCPVTNSSSNNPFQVLFRWLLASPAYLNLFYYSESPEGLILCRLQLLVSKSHFTCRHSHLTHACPWTPISKTGRKICLIGFEWGEVSFKHQHRNVHLDARDQVLHI